MKKIYSFLMALSIVLCANANSFEAAKSLDFSKARPQVVNKLYSADAAPAAKQVMNQQVVRKAVAKKNAATTNLNIVREHKALNAMNVEKQKLNNGVKKVAAKKANQATQADTIVIPADQWVYKYYAETYDWYMAIADADMTYVVNLDYLSTEFTGTYTEADLDMYYSYIQYLDEEGYTNYIDIVEADFTVTDDENGKSADVTILGSDGNVYKTYAYEAPLPEPIGEKTLAYNSCELLDYTQSSGYFQFWAEEEGWYTSIVLASSAVEGEYTRMDMVDPYYNYIAYFTATDTTIIDMLDLNVSITREGKTYALAADVLGTDSILYHITMQYTKPDPADTISIVATDLFIDEYDLGWLVYTSVTASNEEYGVTLTAYDFLPAGEYVGGDVFSFAGSYITDKAAKTESTLTDLALTIAGEGTARTITGSVVTADNILYQLDLSYVVPEVADTVSIVFETPGVAEWYDADSDYFIYNENTEYFVYLDMVTEKNNFAGEFTAEDFLLTYTLVGEINGSDTTTVQIADAKAVVAAAGEGLVHIDAELTGKNGTLYLVSTDVELPRGLKYDEEEGSVYRKYSSSEITITTDYVAQYGELYIEMMAADNSDYVQLLLFVEETADGTIVPVGSYSIDDSNDYGTVAASTGYVSGYGPMPSYYTTLVEQDGSLYYNTFYFMTEGVVAVEEDNGVLEITINATNSFGRPINIIAEYDLGTKQGLKYDMEEGSVDRTYSDADQVEINTDYVESHGQLYLDILAADYSDMLSLVFFVEATDEDIILPAGTYPITDTGDYGTAYASTGYDSDYGAMPCVYSTLVEQGGKLYLNELYFMVSGNIVVENVDGHLKMTIDALNSYDVPAHIVYEAAATAVENVTVKNNASKVLENNQLFIIKEGVKYNVLGNVVK